MLANRRKNELHRAHGTIGIPQATILYPFFEQNQVSFWQLMQGLGQHASRGVAARV